MHKPPPALFVPMKLLLVPLLVLVPLVASASVGHGPEPRASGGAFELELVALGLGPGGVVDLGSESCVAVQARGAASVLWARAELSAPRDVGPGRLQLRSVAPRGGDALVSGAAPLSMEIPPFDLAHRDERALVGVELAEGSVAAAAGTRVLLRLAVEHVGAPLSFAVTPCGDTPGSSG